MEFTISLMKILSKY